MNWALLPTRFINYSNFPDMQRVCACLGGYIRSEVAQVEGFKSEASWHFNFFLNSSSKEEYKKCHSKTYRWVWCLFEYQSVLASRLLWTSFQLFSPCHYLSFSRSWASLPQLLMSTYHLSHLSCLPLSPNSLLSWPVWLCWPCSVCCFLSLICTLPDAPGCSLPHIHNKILPLSHTLEQSHPHFTQRVSIQHTHLHNDVCRYRYRCIRGVWVIVLLFLLFCIL